MMKGIAGIAIEVGPHFCFFIASGNSIADADHHIQFTQVIDSAVIKMETMLHYKSHIVIDTFVG